MQQVPLFLTCLCQYYCNVLKVEQSGNSVKILIDVHGNGRFSTLPKEVRADFVGLQSGPAAECARVARAGRQQGAQVGEA